MNRPIIRKAELIDKKFGLKKDDYILFLGRLVPEKGITYLIESFKNVKTDKKLVIAGGSSDTDEFANQLKEMAKDDDRIIFTGFVQGQLLDELYSNAYIYSLPSDLEGMPLSLLEAMSYGNCCLVSDIDECASVHLAGNGNIGQVVFLTYYCLTALPLIIIFLKEKNLRNLCMLLCIAISVASTKRTGTIALILGILVMLVLDAHIQGSLREKWKKYMYLFIAICIGSGAVLYLENRSGLEIFDRFSKLSTDGGSGRDIIWAITLQAFKTSNIREKIFGHGFQSVYYRLKPGGFSRFSHNSYIEYLYDYGIIGLSLLVLFVLSLIIIEIKFIREKNKYAPVMGMLLIITIFLSAFSYFFEESNIIQPIAVAYGIILGQAHKERKRYEN